MFPDLPRERFDIIYADPPWEYDQRTHYTKASTGRWYKVRHVTSHYPTLTKDELATLDVASIAADDCLLFMWTTGPHMDTSVDLGRDWGFSWITIGFVWDKHRPRPGHYTLSQCEFVCIFKRGRIPQPRGARNVRQFLSEKYGAHSAKPVEIRNRIDAMFPTQRKIELFARRRDDLFSEDDDGWCYWGNEA